MSPCVAPHAGAVTTSWAAAGAFLGLQGGSLTKSGSKFKARITQPAARGTTILYVNTTSAIKAGDWVRLWMLDPDSTRTAGRRLLASDDAPGVADLADQDALHELEGISRQLLATDGHKYLPGSLEVLRRALAISLSDPENTPARLRALRRIAAAAARLAGAFKSSGFHTAAVDGTIVAWCEGGRRGRGRVCVQVVRRALTSSPAQDLWRQPC